MASPAVVIGSLLFLACLQLAVPDTTICDRLKKSPAGQQHPAALAARYIEISGEDSQLQDAEELFLERTAHARVVKRRSGRLVTRMTDNTLSQLCRSGHFINVKEHVLDNGKESYKKSCHKLLSPWSSHTLHGRYLVKMLKGMPDEECHNLVKELKNTWKDPKNKIVGHIFQEFYGESCEFLVESNHIGLQVICNHTSIEYIVEDVLMDDAEEPLTGTQTLFTREWGLDRVDQRSRDLDHHFHSIGNGSGVDIYIIDSGIKYDHEQFEGRADYAGIDYVDVLFGENMRGKDCQGHGSRVASIAVGRSLGIAYGAQVKSLRVGGVGCGSGTVLSALIEAINFIIKQKKANPSKLMVVNLSSKMGYFRLLNEKLEEVVALGVPVVVAAGNDARDACKYSPSSSPDVITVGGIREGDKLYKSGWFGSNYGPCIDIMAPAQYICGANYWSRTSSSCSSGTSYAAPLVAGAVAVLLQLNPMLTPKTVKEILRSHCTSGAMDFHGLPTRYTHSTPNCLLYIGPEILHDERLKSPIPHAVKSVASNYKIVWNISLYELQKVVANNSDFLPVYIQMVSPNTSLIVFQKSYDAEPPKVYAHQGIQQVKNLQHTLKLSGYVITHLKYYNLPQHHIMALVTFTKSNGLMTLQRHANHRFERKLNATRRKGYTLETVTAHVNNVNVTKFTSVFQLYDKFLDYTLFMHIEEDQVIGLVLKQAQKGRYLRHLDTYQSAENLSTSVHILLFHEMVANKQSYPLLVVRDPYKANLVIEKEMNLGYIPIVVARIEEKIVVQLKHYSV